MRIFELAEGRRLYDLCLLSNSDLHRATEALVGQERNLSLQIIRHLREIDRRRAWAEMAYSSLFEYCVKALGYSESQAYRRISALRLIKEVPEVAAKLADGRMNLTTVTQAQSFFRREPGVSKTDVLSLIEGKTQREVETELAKISPRVTLPDQVRPISEDQIQIQFTADQALIEKLKRLRALLLKNPAASYAELLHQVCDLALEKTSRRDASVKRLSAAALRREVLRRDGTRCTYRDPATGRRCDCRTGLEFDHIIPVAKGGANTLANLRLLCRAHNQWAAIQEFGVRKMKAYIADLSAGPGS